MYRILYIITCDMLINHYLLTYLPYLTQWYSIDSLIDGVGLGSIIIGYHPFLPSLIPMT